MVGYNEKILALANSQTLEKKFKVSRLAISISIAIILTACGGGGGGNSGDSNRTVSPSNPPAAPDTPKDKLVVIPKPVTPNNSVPENPPAPENRPNTLNLNNNSTFISANTTGNTIPDKKIEEHIVKDHSTNTTISSINYTFVKTENNANQLEQDINLSSQTPINPFKNEDQKNTISEQQISKYLPVENKRTESLINSTNSHSLKTTKDKFDGIKKVNLSTTAEIIKEPLTETNHLHYKKEEDHKYDGISSIERNNQDTFTNNIEREVIRRWDNNNLEKAFKWDRLERDVKDYGITTYNNNVDYDLSALKDKINDDLAKIAVLDANITLNSAFYEGRFDKVEYIRPNSKNKKEEKNTPIFGHGDKVIGQIIGKPAITNSIYDYRLGFLQDKGKVTFIGYQPDNFNTSSFSAIASSKTLYDAITQRGYNILNISLSNKLNYITYNNIQSDVNTRNLNYYLNFLNYYAKHYDILTVIAAGNYYNKNGSSLAYGGLVFKDKYPEFYKSQLIVGAYNPLNGKAEDYSNHCNENKDTCLFAIGSAITYPKAINNKTALISHGTSFAAPYVSGTLALVHSVFPFMTNYNIQQTVLTTAFDLGEKGVDNVYGWGLVQPLSAIRGPKQFYKDDFVVNFRHNYQYQKKNEIYRFSNDISGNYGLKVYGSNKHNVLSLSGVNTYKGDTVLYPLAIVNIDGIIANSDILTSENSYLYGSGWITNLYNQGTFSNYSIFATKSDHQDETRSQYGMLINGDYIQTKTGKLNVLLGQPLLVKGNVTLAGTLNIAGLKKVFIDNSNNTVLGDALVTQGNLKGTFDNLTTSVSVLTSGKINYHTIKNNQDKTIHVVSVTATYSGVLNKLNTFISPKEEIYPLAKGGAENLDRLNNNINLTREKDRNEFNRLSRYYIATDISEISHNDEISSTPTTTTTTTPLTNFLTDIQNETNIQSIRNTILSLSGSEFINAYQQNQKLIDFTNQQIRENLLTNRQIGFNLGYKFSQLIGKNNNKISLNLLNLNYLTENNLALSLGLTNAQISNQDVISKANNNGNGKAINFSISYPLLEKLNLNYQISYTDLTGKLNRNGILNNNPYAYQHNYHLKSLNNQLFLSHKLAFNHQQSITPYYGLSFTKTNISQITENHTDFNLVLAKQHRINQAWFAGAIYQYQQPFNLRNTDLSLAYQLNKDIRNTHLDGYLSDGFIQSPLEFKQNKTLTQNLNLSLNTQIAKINLKASFITDLKQDKGFNLALSYQFK